MPPELLVKDANAQLLHSLIVKDGLFSVGREPGCAIVLPAPDVSRRHAAFTHSSRFGVLAVEDHGSKNGTFVNGLQMRRCVLYTGDVVRVGNYLIHVRAGSSGPPGMGDAMARRESRVGDVAL